MLKLHTQPLNVLNIWTVLPKICQSQFEIAMIKIWDCSCWSWMQKSDKIILSICAQIQAFNGIKKQMKVLDWHLWITTKSKLFFCVTCAMYCLCLCTYFTDGLTSGSFTIYWQYFGCGLSWHGSFRVQRVQRKHFMHSASSWWDLPSLL